MMCAMKLLPILLLSLPLLTHAQDVQVVNTGAATIYRAPAVASDDTSATLELSVDSSTHRREWRVMWAGGPAVLVQYPSVAQSDGYEAGWGPHKARIPAKYFTAITKAARP